MWSRIWTTCPENPHCGNCGVPFMNSTTSFDFTSLSMNCSMLIFSSFWGGGQTHLAVGLCDHTPAGPPRLPYMYPKRLCIQSNLAVGAAMRARIGRAFGTPETATVLVCFRPKGGFFPRQELLSRTGCSQGTTLRGQRSPLRPGDPSDENSIRHCRLS